MMDPHPKGEYSVITNNLKIQLPWKILVKIQSIFRTLRVQWRLASQKGNVDPDHKRRCLHARHDNLP